LELIIILIIILVLFGGWRLPKIGRNIGRTIGYFKRGMSESKGKEIQKKEVKTKEDKVKDESPKKEKAEEQVSK